MLTLITPTQGNPIALKRTLDSVNKTVDEIIVGSVCVFEDDISLIKSYANEYNIKIIELPFNHIFKTGFSNTLNILSESVSNEVAVYLNVGEVIDKSEGEILDKISTEYNCYYIDHPIEKHRWYRVFCPTQIKWSGLLHEEIAGDLRPFHKPLFTFADTEKDMDNTFKAAVYNDIKELCYFNLYNRIVDEPHNLGATNEGWIKFATDNYDSMKERLLKKGRRYQAFIDGDLKAYLEDAHTNPEFEKERFESSIRIEFQGDKKFLL